MSQKSSDLDHQEGHKPLYKIDLAFEMFLKGTKVEVSRCVGGLKVARYVAKILQSSAYTLNNHPKGRALVEYESLVCDNDERKPLIENVDAAMIRPLPPAFMLQNFEQFDVVDAFYHGGWWKGVVSKVKDFEDENKRKLKKYTVVFENPPAQIEFGASSLRVSSVLANGSWIRLPKRKRMQGLDFRVGMAVAVNLGEEIPSDGWLPAIILEDVGFNSFLVKLRNSNNEEKSGIKNVIIDSFHIWPHKDFVNGNHVSNSNDIKYRKNVQELSRHANNNAQSPKVATQLEYSSSAMDDLKEKNPGRNVGKNSMQSNSPGCAPVLSHPSMKFRKENTADPLYSQAYLVKSTLHQKPKQELDATIRSLTTCSKHQLVCSEHSSENENLVEEPNKEDGGIENFVVEEEIPPKLPVKRQLVLEAGSEKNDIYSAGHMIEVEHKAQRVESFVEWNRGPPAETSCQLFDEDISNVVYNQDQPGHAINHAKSPDVALQLECSRDVKGNIEANTLCTNPGKNPMLQRKTYNGIYSIKRRKTAHRRVKGSAPSSVNTENSATPLYFLEGHAKSMPLEIQNQESKVSISTQTSWSTQYEEPNHQENGVDITVEEHEMLPVSNQEETKDLDEITFSVEELGIPVDSQVEGQLILTAGEEHIVVVGRDMEIKDSTTEVVELPFVKRSPLWKMIESLETFQSIPQKPHFRPLSECKMLDREGSAFCQMVKFANVVEMTSKLQIDSPHEDFNSYLEALGELKIYGFDVEAVVHRLKELLSIKDMQVELQDRSRKVQVQIMDCTLEKVELEKNISASQQRICKLLLKISELKEKLREVEEKRSLELSVKQMNDSQTINLQSESSAIWENILKADHDFERLATTSR